MKLFKVIGRWFNKLLDCADTHIDLLFVVLILTCVIGVLLSVVFGL